MAKPVNKIVWCFLAVGFSLPCPLQTLFYLEIMPIERIPEGASILLGQRLTLCSEIQVVG